jgi:hypothetical protein
MPLNLSDDLMDHLTTMPEDEVNKMYEGMTPQERAEITNYAIDYRQRKTEGLRPQTPIDKMDFTQPAFTQEDIDRSNMPNMDPGSIADRFKTSINQPWSGGDLLENPAVRAVEDSVIDPGIRRLQLQYGRPFIEKGLQQARPDGTPNSPAADLLMRRAAAPVAGSDFVDSSLSEPEQARAAEDLRQKSAGAITLGAMATGVPADMAEQAGQKYGDLGAATAQFAAEQVPQIPTFFVGMGKVNEAVKAATEARLLRGKAPAAVARVIAAAAGAGSEGAVIGGTQGLLSPDQTMAEGTAYGMMFGAGAGTGAQLAGELAPKVVAGTKKVARRVSQTAPVHYVGRLSPEGFKSLAAAFEHPPEPPIKPAGIDNETWAELMKGRDLNIAEKKFTPVEGPWFAQRMSKPKDVMPSFIMVIDVGGKPVARMVELHTHAPAKFHDVDLTDPFAAKSVGQMVKNGVAFVMGEGGGHAISTIPGDSAYYALGGPGDVDHPEQLSDDQRLARQKRHYAEIKRIRAEMAGKDPDMPPDPEALAPTVVAQRSHDAHEDRTIKIHNMNVGDTGSYDLGAEITSPGSPDFAGSEIGNPIQESLDALRAAAKRSSGGKYSPPNPSFDDVIMSIGGRDIEKYASLIKKEGPGFDKQKYPVTADVRITFKDGSVHYDQIKGLNEGHALARAASNWPAAKQIDLLHPDADAIGIHGSALTQNADMGDFLKLGLGPGGKALPPDMRGTDVVSPEEKGLARIRSGGGGNQLPPGSPPRGEVFGGDAKRIGPGGGVELHKEVLPHGYKRGEEVYLGKVGKDMPGHRTGRIVGRKQGDANGLYVQELLPRSVPGEPETIEGGKIEFFPFNEIYPSNAVRIHDMVPEGPEYPPPPGPGDLLPHEIYKINTIRGLYQRFQDGMAKWITGDHFRGTIGVGDLINISKSAKNLEYAPEIEADLKRAFPTQKLLSDFDKDLALAWEGKLRNATQFPGLLKKGEKVVGVMGRDATDAYMTAKYGEAWTKGKAIFEKYLKESQMWQDIIIQHGGVPENFAKLMEDGLMDRYAARMYRTFTMKPGEWAGIVEKSFPELMENAVKFLQDQAAKDYGIIPTSSIQDELYRLLRTDDPLKNGQASNMLGSTFKRLLARRDIPEVLRKLMGEEESGSLRITATLGTQRAIAANLTAMSELVNNRSWYSPGPNPAMGLTMKVPNNSRMYGRAAGGYVHPMFEPIVKMGARLNDGTPMRVLRAIVGWAKTNEVALGGGAPFVNATMGNMYYSALAGGINPLLDPMRSGKYIRDALQLMLDYAQDPSALGKAGQKMIQLRRLGMDIPGFAEVEMATGRDRITRELVSALKAVPDGADASEYMSHFRDASKAVISAPGQAKDAFVSAYGHIDRTFKIANFLALEEKFYNQLTGGASTLWEKASGDHLLGKDMMYLKQALADKKDIVYREVAARKAAERINQSFPNPQNVGKIIAGLRSTAGVFAKYLTYTAEDFRINGMLAKRMVDEPDLRWRLLATSALAYGVFGNKGMMGALRRYNGISDEEVDAAMKDRSFNQRGFRHLVIVPPFRDSKGRLMMIDASQWFGPTRFLNGDPTDGFAKRMISNLITSPVEGGAGESAVNNFLVQTGLARQKDPHKMLEGEGDALNAVNTIWDYGGAPKGPKRIIEALRRNGTINDDTFGRLSRFEEPLTAGETASRFFGVNTEPYTLPTQDQRSPSFTANGMKARSDVRDLHRQLYTLMKRTPPPELESDTISDPSQLNSQSSGESFQNDMSLAEQSPLTDKQKIELAAIKARFKVLAQSNRERVDAVHKAQSKRSSP